MHLTIPGTDAEISARRLRSVSSMIAAHVEKSLNEESLPHRCLPTVLKRGWHSIG
ncbi:hypothetical protein PQR68_02260 [Paraburkholderia agricolaris]|uniref:hypothetical protein n=1 Tax=Paraburkholderia agricolaris TaxID=2152888 RepID=UPI0038BDD793